MTRHLLPFFLAATAAATTPGCALWQAYVQRAAVQEARLALEGVRVEGLDLVGITVAVAVAVENPTDTTMTLDRLEWSLLVNDAAAARGSSQVALSVPPREQRPHTLTVRVAYADLGTQVRQLLLSGGVRAWRLEGTAHLDTPFGSFRYPVRAERREGTHP